MDTSLYAQVYDWDNLLLAHRKAAKGKRGKEPAARFEYHLEDNLIMLQDELRAKIYRPGAYIGKQTTYYVRNEALRSLSVMLSPSTAPLVLWPRDKGLRVNSAKHPVPGKQAIYHAKNETLRYRSG